MAAGDEPACRSTASITAVVLPAAAAVNGSNRIADGVRGLEPRTSSLSGCRRSGSDSGFGVVNWAYARSARFSYLAMSCAYTRAPWRSRATVGPALGPGTFRSVGVGTLPRAVRCGLCAGPIFHSCPCPVGVVRRHGSSIGSSRGVRLHGQDCLHRAGAGRPLISSRRVPSRAHRSHGASRPGQWVRRTVHEWPLGHVACHFIGHAGTLMVPVAAAGWLGKRTPKI